MPNWVYLESLLEQALEEGVTPGLEAVVIHQDSILGHWRMGHRTLRPDPLPLTPQTRWDLASLSKVVGTTTAALLLLERGQIRLDDPVSVFFPQFSQPGWEQVRLRHLLSHTSGLPAWEPLYKTARGRDEYLQGLLAVGLTHTPGAYVEYSCLGFILLGLCLEKASGMGLDEFLRDQVFAPLGMDQTSYGPIGGDVAATEACPERGDPICGTVHDENAWKIGGVSGNAGLFSTAGDLSRFAQMILSDGYPILSPLTIRKAMADQTPGLNARRGLGWDLSGPLCSCGDLLSPLAFGHTGFTGTSLWFDPQQHLAFLLLTNRVHFGREALGIIRLRPRFHNAAAAASIR